MGKYKYSPEFNKLQHKAQYILHDIQPFGKCLTVFFPEIRQKSVTQ